MGARPPCFFLPGSRGKRCLDPARGCGWHSWLPQGTGGPGGRGATLPEVETRGAGASLHEQQPPFSERRAVEHSTREVTREAAPPEAAPPRPSPPPSLPDDGVHGRDALGHDEGLAVGHVVQGGSRVARQDDLRQDARAP